MFVYQILEVMKPVNKAVCACLFMDVSVCLSVFLSVCECGYVWVCIYRAIFPIYLSKDMHHLAFVDPDESQLPESYFLDEEPFLSSGSDSELPNGKATWEENGRQ